MLRKISTLLALALCLGIMSACSDNTADTDIMSESEEITTAVPQTQEIAEGITEEPTDAQPYVKPQFTKYTSKSHISELPSESDYTACELVESCNKTVLGYNAKCEKLKYQTPDGLYMWYTVCTDTATDTVFYQGRGTVTDLNDDGDNEIKNGDYLLINTSDGIMEANIQAAFDSYLKSALPADSEYDFHVGCDGSLIVFAYTVYGQTENVFEEHYVQMRLVGDRFEFGDERSFYRDIYAPFDSNDPAWYVEVSLTEVANLGKYEYSPALYTLTFYGPEDKQFAIYTDNNFLENCSMIYTDQYQDARSQRRLIVHPNYDYAILLYPYANQTADNCKKTIAALIDLNAGCIVSSQSGMEEAAFSLSNPYYLFQSAEEAREEYRKCDFMGISIHSILLDVEITDSGFEITANLHTDNSDSTVSNSFSIDLASISQSVPDNRYILLEYSPYSVSTEEPSDEEWQLKKEYEYDNVLGRNIVVKSYNSQSYDVSGWYSQIKTVSDAETSEILLSCYGYDLLICDIDDDGEREVVGLVSNSEGALEYMLWTFRDGEILSSYLDRHLAAYIGEAPQTVRYYFSGEHQSFIQYLLPGEAAHETVQGEIFVNMTADRLEITKEKVFYICPDVEFTSNSSDVHTEIIFPSDETTYVYTLNLYYKDRVYSFDNTQLKYEPEAYLSRKRTVTVHPSLNYAVLVYPHTRETTTDMAGMFATVISLSTGEIVDTYIGYYLNGEYNMEIIELLYESNVYQYTVNWLDCSVTPVENGFDLVWSVIDENGITVYQAFETVHLDQQ